MHAAKALGRAAPPQGREQDLLRLGMVVAALSVVTRIVLAFLLARWRRRGLARPAS